MPVATFGDWIGRQIDAFAEGVEDPNSQETPDLTEAWLAELAENQRGTVQLSMPAPVLADDLEQAIEMLGRELLIDPETAELAYLRRTRAVSRLREAYRHSGEFLKQHVQEKADVLVAGRIHQRMDFAVVNGRPVQLAHAWSFQTPDQEALSRRLRAWAWSMTRLRDDGAQLRGQSGKVIDVPRDVEIDVVVVPPRPDQPDVSAYPEGQDAFQRLNVIENSLEDVPKVIMRASALLGAK